MNISTTVKLNGFSTGKFIGNLALNKDMGKVFRKAKSKGGDDYVSLNIGVTDGDSTVFVGLFGMMYDSIKVKFKDENKDDVEKEFKRNKNGITEIPKEDMEEIPNYLKKRVRLLPDENGKHAIDEAFIDDADLIRTLEENINEIRNAQFYISAALKPETYKGELKMKWELNSITQVAKDKEREPGLYAEVPLVANLESVDKHSFEKLAKEESHDRTVDWDVMVQIYDKVEKGNKLISTGNFVKFDYANLPFEGDEVERTKAIIEAYKMFSTHFTDDKDKFVKFGKDKYYQGVGQFRYVATEQKPELTAEDRAYIKMNIKTEEEIYKEKGKGEKINYFAFHSMKSGQGFSEIEFSDDMIYVEAEDEAVVNEPMTKEETKKNDEEVKEQLGSMDIGSGNFPDDDEFDL